MHPLEKKTLQIIVSGSLFESGDSILVAVSGGPDSMSLMHVLSRLAELEKYVLTVAYVNHGLRLEEALKEEELVAIQAQRLDLPCVITRVDVSTHAVNTKKSLEHSARDLRYQALEEIAHDRNLNKIALAHTADDQAEELLIRLIRGTGRKGLSGMKEARAGRYYRPFLSIAKKELLDYLQDRKIPYLVDSSNNDTTILRNRVRLQLIPFLADSFNPNIRETLVRTATILQEEESLLEELTESAECAIFSEPANEDLQKSPETPRPLHINLSLIAEQPPAIRRRLFEKACWKMNFRPSFRIINRIDNLVTSQEPTGPIHLANGLRVKKDNKEKLIFHYPQGCVPARGNLETEETVPSLDIAIPEPGEYHVEELGKTFILDCPALPLEEILSGQAAGDFIDLAAITFPLTLRYTRLGDRFHPLGGPGSQKVKDYLSNLKMPASQRKLTPILLANEKVIALPGLRIDQRFRVTENTKKLLRIRMLNKT